VVRGLWSEGCGPGSGAWSLWSGACGLRAVVRGLEPGVYGLWSGAGAWSLESVVGGWSLWSGVWRSGVRGPEHKPQNKITPLSKGKRGYSFLHVTDTNS
jgi:hypothetical protein